MMYYGGMGWFWWILFAVILVVPFWRLLPRYGMPAPLAVIAVFPLAAVVLLWIMAFKDDLTTGAGGSQ